MAVDDLLSLIAFFGKIRPQEIPEEIVAHLNEQGITDKDQQIEPSGRRGKHYCCRP